MTVPNFIKCKQGQTHNKQHISVGYYNYNKEFKTEVVVILVIQSQLGTRKKLNLHGQP